MNTLDVIGLPEWRIATRVGGRAEAPHLTSRGHAESHNRIRHDRIDKTGSPSLSVAGKLRYIGIGRTHARTHVILLIQDLDVRVVHAATGELLRELTIDPNRDYQPTGRPPGPPKQK